MLYTDIETVKTPHEKIVLILNFGILLTRKKMETKKLDLNLVKTKTVRITEQNEIEQFLII